MIIDTVKNDHLYFRLDKRIEIALEILRKNNLRSKTLGRFDILGDEIFAIVQQYQTKSQNKGQWEAHRNYIDIHLMLSGIEKIGYANIKELKVLKPYDKPSDTLILSGQGNFLTLGKDNFVIFYPQDAHMSGLSISDKKSKIRKIVVKVKYDRP